MTGRSSVPPGGLHRCPGNVIRATASIGARAAPSSDFEGPNAGIMETRNPSSLFKVPHRRRGLEESWNSPSVQLPGATRAQPGSSVLPVRFPWSSMRSDAHGSTYRRLAGTAARRESRRRAPAPGAKTAFLPGCGFRLQAGGPVFRPPPPPLSQHIELSKGIDKRGGEMVGKLRVNLLKTVHKRRAGFRPFPEAGGSRNAAAPRGGASTPRPVPERRPLNPATRNRKAEIR